MFSLPVLNSAIQLKIIVSNVTVSSRDVSNMFSIAGHGPIQRISNHYVISNQKKQDLALPLMFYILLFWIKIKQMISLFQTYRIPSIHMIHITIKYKYDFNNQSVYCFFEFYSSVDSTGSSSWRWRNFGCFRRDELFLVLGFSVVGGFSNSSNCLSVKRSLYQSALKQNGTEWNEIIKRNENIQSRNYTIIIF